MANAEGLIDYLRRCYEADNREMSIENILHSKYRQLFFLSGHEQAFSGTINQVMLPEVYGQSLQLEALKYRREKTLIYSGFLIVGRQVAKQSRSNGRDRDQLCAPLVYLKGGVEEFPPGLAFRADLSDLQVNLALIESLLALEPEKTEQGLLSIVDALPALPWPREKLHTIAAILAEALPAVDFGPLSSYPYLVGEDEVRRLASSESLSCVPACALMLVPNSIQSRGVLHELNELQSQSTSQTLDCLLSGKRITQKGRIRKKDNSPVPAILSAAQQRILTASRSETVSVVIGPPGTGKSYTIANIAIEHLSRGQTVLVASRMDQAVDVVYDKIVQLIGMQPSIVRAGRKEYMRELQTSLDNLLLGFEFKSSPGDVRECYRRLKSSQGAVEHIEDFLPTFFERHIQWSAAEAEPARGIRGLLQTVQKHWLDWQLAWTKKSSWELIQEYQRALAERTLSAASFVRISLRNHLAQLLKLERENLIHFQKAIRARSDGKQQQFFEVVNFEILLRAFPVWLCKLSDLSNVLPLKENLFDLAILDEASQCDIASSLPLVQRAKRIVIVGDPKQLRHVTFLPIQSQSQFAKNAGLDSEQEEVFNYRDHSILDLAVRFSRSSEQIAMLNEHFRSLPGIIEFSNREFYADSLSLMRSGIGRQQANEITVKFTGGNRNDARQNIAELEAVVNSVLEIIQQQERLPANAATSIGILSPFREQIDAIWKELARQTTYKALEKHELLAGTAHTFQGEERDVMFLSLAVDSDSHAATFRFLDNPNLLNVAVTRARHRQVIFHSFNIENLRPTSLLRKYLEYVSSERTESFNHSHVPNRDAFLSDVKASLEAQGMRCWLGCKIAGIVMDLLVTPRPDTCEGVNNLSKPQPSLPVLGVDLVGFPGEQQGCYGLERYRVLYRAGLIVMPISYREWLQNRADCIDAVTNSLAVQLTG